MYRLEPSRYPFSQCSFDCTSRSHRRADTLKALDSECEVPWTRHNRTTSLPLKSQYLHCTRWRRHTTWLHSPIRKRTQGIAFADEVQPETRSSQVCCASRSREVDVVSVVCVSHLLSWGIMERGKNVILLQLCDDTDGEEALLIALHDHALPSTHEWQSIRLPPHTMPPRRRTPSADDCQFPRLNEQLGSMAAACAFHTTSLVNLGELESKYQAHQSGMSYHSWRESNQLIEIAAITRVQRATLFNQVSRSYALQLVPI